MCIEKQSVTCIYMLSKIKFTFNSMLKDLQFIKQTLKKNTPIC